MDQSLLAGIGNIYSDEILFHARVHPQDKVDRLRERQLNQIDKMMKNVLHKTIRYEADPHRVPRSWLLSHRSKNTACPRCGNKLQRITINQRSAYLCPKCQPP
jgi:formamidopyrimidine-DNA glycosylase